MDAEAKFLHDLATPLTVVEAMLGLAAECAEEEPASRADLLRSLQRAQEASLRVRQLMDERRHALAKEAQP
jgi:hypothetical protein